MMSGLEVTRDVSAIAVALGLVGLLAPPPRVPRTLARGAALVVAVAAWAVLTVTLLPSGDTIRDRLMSPVGAGAALVGAVTAAGGLWLAGRAVLRKPVWWFVLLGVTMPLRIPVPLGGEDRNLLLPLYLVIAAGVAAAPGGVRRSSSWIMSSISIRCSSRCELSSTILRPSSSASRVNSSRRLLSFARSAVARGSFLIASRFARVSCARWSSSRCCCLSPLIVVSILPSSRRRARIGSSCWRARASSSGTCSASSISRIARSSQIVTEVREGYECGLTLTYSDIKEGDVIETYELVEKERL